MKCFSLIFVKQKKKVAGYVVRGIQVMHLPAFRVQNRIIVHNTKVDALTSPSRMRERTTWMSRTILECRPTVFRLPTTSLKKTCSACRSIADCIHRSPYVRRRLVTVAAQSTPQPWFCSVAASSLKQEAKSNLYSTLPTVGGIQAMPVICLGEQGECTT